MPTFLPYSGFGRKCLRNTFESEGTHLFGYLLNVPVDTPGDRSTWTWSANWKNFRIPGIRSGLGSTSISFLSQGDATPQDVVLFEPYTSVAPGAYYTEGSSSDNIFTYFLNNTGSAITFTHVAWFINQSGVTVLDPDSPTADNSLILVQIFNPNVTSSTLNEGQYLYVRFDTQQNFGGAIYTHYDSFESFVAADEATIIDIVDGTNLYLPPYPTLGLSFVERAFSANTKLQAYFTQTYSRLLGSSVTIGQPGFIAEALNVTDTEPDFDADWTAWSTYRVNRYATNTVDLRYKHEQKQDTYSVFDPFFDGTFTINWQATQVSLLNNVEFLFTAPSSGSFTYTHIAVFLNTVEADPLQGSNYNYPDLDNFMGVIKLPASVTLSSGAVARAYPFNLSYIYNPFSTIELIEGS